MNSKKKVAVLLIILTCCYVTITFAELGEDAVVSTPQDQDSTIAATVATDDSVDGSVDGSSDGSRVETTDSAENNVAIEINPIGKEENNITQELPIENQETVVEFPAVAIHTPKESTVYIDPKTSVLNWKGEKVLGAHNGVVRIKDGLVKLSDDNIVSGLFAIEMSTIESHDLTESTGKGKLEGHLKSADFFNVSAFPLTTLKIIEGKLIEKTTGDGVRASGKFNIKAELTMIGSTQPIEFPAEITFNGDKVHAKTTIVIDRTNWGLKYGSGKFFQGLGNKLIKDEFIVEVLVQGCLDRQCLDAGTR